MSVRDDIRLRAFTKGAANSASLTYRWECFDVKLQNTCFSSLNQFIMLPSSAEVSIAKYLLYPGREYEIMLTVSDQTGANSATNMITIDTISTIAISVVIESPANNNGFLAPFLDNGFVATATYIPEGATNHVTVDPASATYVWQVKDSSGTDVTGLVAVSNGLRIAANSLLSDVDYEIKVSVTLGSYYGEAKVDYTTKSNIFYKIGVDPPTGAALNTIFTLTASTQVFAADLAEFEFGIVIGGKDRPLNRKGFHHLIQTILPYDPSSTADAHKVYVEITSSNGYMRREEKEIVLTAPTLTEADFLAELDSSAYQTLSESVRVREMLSQLNGALVDESVRIKAMQAIVDGMKHEDHFMDTSSRLVAA